MEMRDQVQSRTSILEFYPQCAISDLANLRGWFVRAFSHVLTAAGERGGPRNPEFPVVLDFFTLLWARRTREDT